jgi:hypothetical protein
VKEAGATRTDRQPGKRCRGSGASGEAARSWRTTEGGSQGVQEKHRLATVRA